MNVCNVVICLLIYFSYRNCFVQSIYTNGTPRGSRTNVFSKVSGDLADLVNIDDYIPASEQYYGQKNDLTVLDITKHKSTNNIEYAFNNATNTHIFTATGSKGIDRVTNGFRVIWDPVNNEHADQVAVKYNEDDEPMVRIHSTGDDFPNEFTNRLSDAKIRRKVDNNHVKYESPSHTHQALSTSQTSRLKNAFHTLEYGSKHDEGFSSSMGTEYLNDLHQDYEPKPVEIDINIKTNTNTFSYSVDEKIVTYHANHHYCFNSIKDGDTTIWQAEHPSKCVLSIGVDGIIGDKDNNGDENKESDKMVTIHQTNGNLKVFFKESGKDWVEGTSNIDLDVSKSHHCYGCDYSTVGNTATYKARNGYLFKSLKNGNDLIWEADGENEYAKEVVRDGIGTFKSLKNIAIMFPNGEYIHLTKSKNRWTERSSEVELDVSKKEESFEYHYDRFGQKKPPTYITTDKSECAAFVPKNGYKFKVVKEGDNIIWNQNDDVNNLIKNVVRDGVKTLSSLSNVTIFFEDGNFRTFSKTGGKWHRESDIKFYTLNTSDQNELVELPSDMYTVDRNGEDLTYLFKQNSKCGKISYFHKVQEALYPSLFKTEVVELFKLKSEADLSSDSYPTRLTYLWQNKIVINFKGRKVNFEKDSADTWHRLDYDIELIARDPNANNNNNIVLNHSMYDFKRMGDGQYSYDIKKDVNCFMVKLGSVPVWKYGQYGYEKYPSTVSYVNKNKILVDFGKDLIVCEKDPDGNWKNMQMYLKLYTQDEEDNNKMIKLNGDHCTLDKGGSSQLYSIKEGVKCTKVRLVENVLYPEQPKHEATDDLTIWEYDPSKNEGQFPRSILLERGDKITIRFQGGSLTYEKDAQGKWAEGKLHDLTSEMSVPPTPGSSHSLRTSGHTTGVVA